MPSYPITSSDLVGVPIGTILPFVGPLANSVLGDHWRFCDGTILNLQGSPLNGKRLPALHDIRSIIGVGGEADVNEGTGKNEWEKDGSHPHQGSTNSITRTTNSPTVNYTYNNDPQVAHSHGVDVAGGSHDHGSKLPARFGV